jgi:hypothetical protein
MRIKLTLLVFAAMFHLQGCMVNLVPVKIWEDAFDGSRTATYGFNKHFYGQSNPVSTIYFSWSGRHISADSVSATLRFVTYRSINSTQPSRELKIKVNDKNFTAVAQTARSEFRSQQNESSTTTSSTDTTGMVSSSTSTSENTVHWNADHYQIPISPDLLAEFAQANEASPLIFQIYVNDIPLKMQLNYEEIKSLRRWAQTTRTGKLVSE